MSGPSPGEDRPPGRFGRRALLATGLSVGTAGCVRRTRSVVTRDDVDQLSVTITTLPADGDRESVRLARDVATWFEAAGMDASIEMRSNAAFLRSILVNHDFDVYVGRHPAGPDPDFLYEALHSRFAEEAGWQNPFGFANVRVDERLEAQRSADPDDREAAVASALEALVTRQPFVPICTPKEYRVVRTDRFDGWGERHPATSGGYLGLEARETDEGLLRAAHTDARPSANLNPLAVEYRNQGTITGLLYDSLGTDTESGTVRPWLAADWTWDDATLTVDLRDDCRFHDGTAITAADVAFTYRFLTDTTLGEREFPAPTPRFRGRIAAVDDVTELADDRLAFAVDANEAIAERALLVPVLPEHVWRDRTGPATVLGFEPREGATEALVTENVPPVGSGPYRFEGRTEREHVTFERFDDHFTRREGVDLPAATAERVRFAIDPRSTSAIELVEDGDADVTSLALESYVVDDVLESTPPDVEVLESPSWTFYHLGFNTRRAPFSNPNFRRAVAQLIDERWTVETVFDGHARPLSVPVVDDWTPADLAWDGDDPTFPFLGMDGVVDPAAARTAFEDAGFRYADDGTLRVSR